jgi:hypothetical protein
VEGEGEGIVCVIFRATRADFQYPGLYDRHRLICEGPDAWKRIGVRDINLRSLVQRLEQIERHGCRHGWDLM